MARPLRHTHPQPPLYQGGVISPQSVSPVTVTQHQGDLEIDYTQLVGTNPSYTKAETDALDAALAAQEASDVSDINDALDLKAPLDSPALTGTPTAPTPADGDDSTAVATTAFVMANSGGSTRDTATVTTVSLASLATDDTQTAALGKSGTLLRVETDRPARVRLYATAAAMAADSTRLAGDDPTGESEVLLDLVTTADTLDFILAPKVAYSSDEDTPSSDLSVNVQNLDTITSTVTVTFTKITVES